MEDYYIVAGQKIPKIDNTLQAGDYVICELYKGFFMVVDNVLVKRISPLTNEVEVVSMLMLKKALNQKFECKNLSSVSCCPNYCKKVDDITREKIEQVFDSDAKAKKKFEEFKFTETALLQIHIAVDSEQEEELLKTMTLLKDKYLTQEDIYNIPVIKNNEYEDWCDIEEDQTEYGIVFVNYDLKRNEDNWYLYKLEVCEQE